MQEYAEEGARVEREDGEAATAEAPPLPFFGLEDRERRSLRKRQRRRRRPRRRGQSPERRLESFRPAALFFWGIHRSLIFFLRNPTAHRSSSFFSSRGRWLGPPFLLHCIVVREVSKMTALGSSVIYYNTSMGVTVERPSGKARLHTIPLLHDKTFQGWIAVREQRPCHP